MRRSARRLVAIFLLALSASAMTDDLLRSLRRETLEVFYHGFDGYMEHAFPEDELKPVECGPLFRDRQNPAHIEINDVLGNYSLTLIDSLSTLAVLASSPEPLPGRDAFADFQDGVLSLVELYGDGSDGPSGRGKRNRGFDLDSKVQVFETVIRGVGGLLSAHLFAVGDLPVDTKRDEEVWRRKGFRYDGQLLRLAEDLAKRLVPAFHTETGLPYPRVNLRHGVPFYTNSPLNADAEHGFCSKVGEEEITETCSAGAGSLVLEFATLSRLTGDSTYEELARRAFWAVWDRRSTIDLIGSGIDAESGQWVTSSTGIGAGIDSFFEYALKSHILLSGGSDSAGDFLEVWREAHAGIKKHLYRGAGYQHPHYVQGDLFTGAVRASWMDSLSAYYPGLLTLGGELGEAIEAHMLFAALWTRYSALPERWSTATGTIDGGLHWWGGRPEFIESTWYLYRATQDPWYLHIGEMVLRDIKRRCWTPCGWAGLEDVRTGELKDRMESFFLGETAKYLYLLFDPSHPLNRLDASFVFSTEGHPLILPSSAQARARASESRKYPARDTKYRKDASSETCPAPPLPRPFTVSVMASRTDLFHAARLAQLHRNLTAVESSFDDTNFTAAVLRSPNNYTFYPWTLPRHYIPATGTSSKMASLDTFDLSFPNVANSISGALLLKRVNGGVMISSISGIKLGMTGLEEGEGYRIHSVGHINLGLEEKVYISAAAVAPLNPVDPFFTRHKDLASVEIVVDLPPIQTPPNTTTATDATDSDASGSLLNLLLQHFSDDASSDTKAEGTVIKASVATGPGAGPLPDVVPDNVPWTSAYFGEEICDAKLEDDIPTRHQVLVIKRGGCSFSEKLRNVPAFAPSRGSVQLVIVVSYPNHGDSLITPLLDETQETPGGLKRAHPMPMVMVDGGEETISRLKRAHGIGLKRRYRYECQGRRIANLEVV